jgi:hypothetical protein
MSLGRLSGLTPDSLSLTPLKKKKSPLANCAGNPTFQPYASGGDGTDTQFCSWDFILFYFIFLSATLYCIECLGGHHKRELASGAL